MPRAHPLLTLTLRLFLLFALAATALPAAQPLRAQACTDKAELVEQTFDPPAALLPPVIAPDTVFRVSWTLQNVGDCTWGRTYRAIFIHGDRLEGARTTRLHTDVAPGESITLTLELNAPGDLDTYSGTWRLRNRAGDTFGPDLTVAIEVSDEIARAAAATDVVLPEVLAFGGAGGAGDAEAISFCLDFGAVPGVPTLVIDYDALQYHYTTLYLCGLPEGAEITVAITDPEGNLFRRDYVEDAPVTIYDEADNEYTSTVLHVPLRWIEQAPRGLWLVEVTSGEYVESAPLEVLPVERLAYPTLDTWPTTPIDPFIAAENCHYGFLPGQALMIGGEFLPPNAHLTVGVYQDRLTYGYFIEQFGVQTDEKGHFVHEHTAWSEPGQYTLAILEKIVPEGFSEDGTEYDLSFAGDTAFGCAQVILPEALSGEPEVPLRLLFHAGEPHTAQIEVMELHTGQGYPLTETRGQCSTIEAAWWPDGEWVIYQSNCIRTETEDGWFEMSAGEDYDLYGARIDFTFSLSEAEKYIWLTDTPDLHEVEPDADAEGLIVYVQIPVQDGVEGSGELTLLDILDASNVGLGLAGRAPTWSPDGTRIAFMSDLDGTWQIYAYDVEEEEVWLVSRGCDTHCRLPAWSPDGRQIIYHKATSLEDFTPTGLWIAPAKGIARPRLFLAGEYARPSWSEQGWIAFQGPDGIYRAPDEVAAGEEPQVHRYLYSDPNVETYAAPVWSR